MILRKSVLALKITFLYIFSFFLSACVDPVTPEFEFKEGLIFIDGFASVLPGTSFVTVSESVLDGEKFSNEFVRGAEVSFKNVNTGELIFLVEEAESYAPADEFAAAVGDVFELNVILPNGSQYQSLPETIIEPVPIRDMRFTYDPQLSFRDDLGGFVPGHSVLVSFEDPSDRENYYYWRFRSFETLVLCEICEDGIFRNGRCEKNPPDSNRKDYYVYLCTPDCWRIRYNENIKIFSDAFANGTTVEALAIADVFLYTKRDVLVEIQQFSISATAYDYYKTLKDISDNSGSFNAPPPAALLGNMFSINDSEEFVLGRFTAASASMESVFIDRSSIRERQIEGILTQQFEEYPEVPAVDATITAPCRESRFSTGIRPTGWKN